MDLEFCTLYELTGWVRFWAKIWFPVWRRVIRPSSPSTNSRRPRNKIMAVSTNWKLYYRFPQKGKQRRVQRLWQILLTVWTKASLNRRCCALENFRACSSQHVCRDHSNDRVECTRARSSVIKQGRSLFRGRVARWYKVLQQSLAFSLSGRSVFTTL